MIVRSVRHRGLRRLLGDDNPRFLRRDLTGRLRNIPTALVLAENIDEFAAFAPPGWRVHRLSGERRNEWSVSASGNWWVTLTRTAEILGVRRATLSALLNGKAALSPEMALRIEKAFEVSMDMLLRMQAWHDAARMRACSEHDRRPAL